MTPPDQPDGIPDEKGVPVPAPPPDDAPPAPVAARPSRLTVVEYVYHHAAGYHAEAVVSRYSSPLASDEQHYSRRLKADAHWSEVKGSWVEDAAAVVIANAAKPPAAVVLVVGILPEAEPDRDQFSPPVPTEPVAFALLAPGESCRFRPADVKRLRVRSATEDVVPYTVNVFPA